MTERDRILIALVKELLGPRNGPGEILPEDQDPRDEYMTGVLEPLTAPRPADNIDAGVEELAAEVVSVEEQDAEAPTVAPSILSPALAPQDLPRSIGLSFTVQALAGRPTIEVCATWARYEPNPQGWKRCAERFLTGPVEADHDQPPWRAGAGVSLQLRSSSLPDGRWRVSLFLVNVTRVAGQGRAATREHLFQPQIRVHCCAGTDPVPVRTEAQEVGSDGYAGSQWTEEKSLAMLYRERAALARGHMCGATWQAIDPERPHPSLESPCEAPFGWTDAGIVSIEDRSKFSPADIRTELMPCFPIEAPQMDWDARFGPPPTLDPEVLAEAWEPQEVRQRLQPLIDGYKAWIEGQESLVPGLSEAQQPVARAHLLQCRDVLQRLQSAIDLLARDADVQLAFCFANRAIALQSQWVRGSRLTWRPFQLAFVLLNIPALADPLRGDRRTCDLLWFPTGGGKTEAYLGLAAFTLALRRRRAHNNWSGDRTGGGTGVLSRYTLRLLTIQQFRRALGVITACERLRVWGLDSPGSPVGWRPARHPNKDSMLWGGLRFSVGLWVGGSVTPNGLYTVGPVPGPTGFMLFVGALDILKGARSGYDGPDQPLKKKIQSTRHLMMPGEPAQVLACPCCRSTLAVSEDGFGPGQHCLHLTYCGGSNPTPSIASPQSGHGTIVVDDAVVTSRQGQAFCTLSIKFTVAPDRNLTARQVDDWWYHTIVSELGPSAQLLSARPARPGYFIQTYENVLGHWAECDFEIFCPNPECELNQHAWAEQVPVSRANQNAQPAGAGPISKGIGPTRGTAALPLRQGLDWQEVPEWCHHERRQISRRIPIPALTVDDQVYGRCPSMVIATVDKFARLAFEPGASALFGNVDYYHSRWGYYRKGCPPSTASGLPSARQEHPGGFAKGHGLHVPVAGFPPPDLILQDELHLIEGPVGSMVGLYEASVDLLCQRPHENGTIVAKYIASTATVRQAESQVQSLYDRRLAQFPPWSIRADDRFFAREREIHPLESDRPGRLYVGVCAPGRGAQTPIVRIWSTLLQMAHERWLANPSAEVDRFFTLVGYFNAIRELAGALSLYRQDIPQRMLFRAGNQARALDRSLELSSRCDSLLLPAMLESLATPAPDGQDVVFATSMFGTGVDVDRLGLMVVHGQPKTTASYIQATGRVGRQGGGLVVTFLRASRPRDLDHYEFFTGYHRALHRHVEPITVAPFSPRARERALGPLAVILLRHARFLSGHAVHEDWRVQQRLSGAYYCLASRMATCRHAAEVTAIEGLLEARAGTQPGPRRPPTGTTRQEMASELDRWASLAGQNPDTDLLVYCEPAVLHPAGRCVVLGDAQHRTQGLLVAYENAPQSLREIEETTGFKS